MGSWLVFLALCLFTALATVAKAESPHDLQNPFCKQAKGEIRKAKAMYQGVCPNCGATGPKRQSGWASRFVAGERTTSVGTNDKGPNFKELRCALSAISAIESDTEDLYLRVSSALSL